MAPVENAEPLLLPSAPLSQRHKWPLPLAHPLYAVIANYAGNWRA